MEAAQLAALGGVRTYTNSQATTAYLKCRPHSSHDPSLGSPLLRSHLDRLPARESGFR